MSDSPSYEVTLLLLSPPLGWLGLHHFYLGNRKKGSLYILLFLTGIPVILATFDTIIILKKGKEKFIEKHGSEEELDEYYVQELMKRRPELIMASAEERREHVSEIREEDIEDATNSKDNSENDESHEETESGDDDEDDSIYSEYYGDWE